MAGEVARTASPLRRGGSASAETERFLAGAVAERPPSQSLRDSSPRGRATGGRRGGSALAESERFFAGDVVESPPLSRFALPLL